MSANFCFKASSETLAKFRCIRPPFFSTFIFSTHRLPNQITTPDGSRRFTGSTSTSTNFIPQMTRHLILSRLSQRASDRCKSSGEMDFLRHEIAGAHPKMQHNGLGDSRRNGPWSLTYIQHHHAPFWVPHYRQHGTFGSSSRPFAHKQRTRRHCQV